MLLQSALASLVDAAQLSVSRRWIATLIGTTLTALTLLLVLCLTAPGPHYILVIDSGSTGTRIHAYQWRERFHKLPLIEPVPLAAARHKVPRRQAGDNRAYDRVETEPGLDQYINDPQGLVEKALAPLLEWAQEVIPGDRWENTPVFLFATAGLRKLPDEHQANILGTVRHVLAASPFRFKPQWATTISGEREGIFGWISLNYLSGYLAPHPLFAAKAASLETDAESAQEDIEAGKTVQAADEGLKTVGALDLGGSSLEVTYVPETSSAGDVKANVSVLGVKYSLFTQAHHRYGLNDAFDRSVSILLEGPALRDAQDKVWEGSSARLKSATSSEVDIKAGLQQMGAKQVDAGKLANSIKVGIRRSLSGVDTAAEPRVVRIYHPCVQAGYSKPYRRIVDSGELKPLRVTLIGKPNWQACQELSAMVVNATAPCLQAPCALGAHHPPTRRPIYALTGFYVVYHFFSLEPSATLDELEGRGRRFCDTEWDAIAARRGAEIHIEHYCFRVPYIITLLRQGLGLPKNQTRIGSGREAWTLGAALAEGSKVGAGRGPKRKEFARELLMAAAGIAFLLWTFFLGWTWRRQKANNGTFVRKASGTAPDLGIAGKLYHKGGAVTMPYLQHSSPGLKLPANYSPGPGAGVPASPTAAIGGNFNSNIARLSAKASQRKRIPSMDNLQTLH